MSTVLQQNAHLQQDNASLQQVVTLIQQDNARLQKAVTSLQQINDQLKQYLMYLIHSITMFTVFSHSDHQQEVTHLQQVTRQLQSRLDQQPKLGSDTDISFCMGGQPQ